MKAKSLLKLFVPAIAVTMGVSSCQDYDAEFTEKKIQYTNEFEKAFGKVDPKQDWSMATLVEGHVNLPDIKGTAKMNICTGDPRSSSTRLLAQIWLQDGKGETKFNAIKGRNNVFVTVEQDGVYKLFGQRTIVNGMLNIGAVEDNYSSLMTRAFSSTCPVTKDGPEVTLGYTYTDLTTLPGLDPSPKVLYLTRNSEKHSLSEWKEKTEEAFNNAGGINHSLFQYNSGNNCPFKWQSIVVYYDAEGHDANQGFTGLHWDSYELEDGVISEEEDAGSGSGSAAPTHNIKLQYLSGVETAAAQPWYRAEGYSLYGYDGFFEEQAHYFEAHRTILNHDADKLSLYGSTLEEQIEFMRKLEGGFEITSTGGPIELPFIYGATDKSNQLGYVIYETGEDPLAQTHYVLMNDGRPAANIFQDSWKGDQIDYSKTLPGFGNTSIVNFILDQIDSRWETELSRPMKGTNSWCYCNEGTGIWSAEGEHLAECPAKDEESATCICQQAGDGKYFTENRVHGDACKDPAIEYKNMLNTPVYGTTYRLAYWDAAAKGGEGAFTYNIPAGKKIVFFIMTQAANTKPQDDAEGNHPQPDNYNYSLPSLNKRIGHDYFNTNSPTYSEMKDKGAVKSAAWTAGGVTYLGFEDGGNDEDLNDIVFVVSGNYSTSKEIPVLHTVKWHLNVNGIHEDNDIVKVENLKQGDTYAQPASNPANGDATFLGWSTSPTGSVVIPASQSDYSGTMGNSNINYYAIWDTPQPTPDPDWVRWIFACEDLGGTFDYDFNDVVLEFVYGWKQVSNTHVEEGAYGGEGNGATWLQAYAEIYLHAAGGTLPAEVYYGDELLIANGMSEIHQIFGQDPASVYNIVNATNPLEHPTPIRIKKFSDADAQYFMDAPANVLPTVMDNLKIKVTHNDGDSHFVTAPQTGTPHNGTNRAPEIIVLPYDWEWPTENTCIKDAYSFTNWVNDATWTQWNQTKKPGTTVSRQN